jgi:hypothetical protein
MIDNYIGWLGYLMQASLPFVAALLFPAFMAFILLATMLAYCPVGLKLTSMFQYMFLQKRCPATDPGNIRCLAARADKLWTSYKQRSHDLVEMIKEPSAQ